MSTTNAKHFLKKTEADQPLQEKLRTILNVSKKTALAEVVQIAAEAGFTFTAADYEAAFKEILMERHATGELSNEDLVHVAGGRAIIGLCSASR